MPDYSKCLIYKLCCKDLNVKEIYVGSTCNFTRRKGEHKSYCHNDKDRHYHLKVYKFIRDNGGFQNWDMILVEEYPCENKQQKLQRERYWYEELKASLNYDYPARIKKEWYEDNKEFVKKYQEANKEKISERKKTKVICECGEEVGKSHLARHKKSQKHLENLSNLNNNESHD